MIRRCRSSLPALTCAEAVDAVAAGETIQVDMASGQIHCAAGTYQFPPLLKQVMDIFEAGGLVPYTRKRLTLLHE